MDIELKRLRALGFEALVVADGQEPSSVNVVRAGFGPDHSDLYVCILEYQGAQQDVVAVVRTYCAPTGMDEVVANTVAEQVNLEVSIRDRMSGHMPAATSERGAVTSPPDDCARGKAQPWNYAIESVDGAENQLAAVLWLTGGERPRLAVRDLKQS